MRVYLKKTVLSLTVLSLCFCVPAAFAVGKPKNLNYRIGSDDQLDISILSPQNLTVTAAVSPDGTITFPYVGSIKAKDKTLEEFQASLTTSLGAFMQYPVVSVSLKESKSRLFFVYGEVVKPGEYQLLSEDITVLRAIAMAGGLTQRAWPVNVLLIRKDKDGKTAKMTVNLKKAESDPSLDLPVVSGDMITVPEGRFFVYGEVTRPGEYPAQYDVTVMRAVAMAGGITKFGSSSNVRLIRWRTDGSAATIPVNLRSIENNPSSDEAVLPGDVIHVSEGSF